MGRIYFPQFKKGKEGIPLKKGKTILAHARELGIAISSECGGGGKCGKCTVRIEKGKQYLSSLTKIEKDFGLSKDLRLACQARVLDSKGNILVYIKTFGEYSILTETREKDIPLIPLVERKGNKVYYDGKEVDVYRGGIYGLAIDLGTTTVVFSLVDLERGTTLSTSAFKNPQVAYGNDVISRIEYTMVDKEKIRYVDESEKGRRVKELQSKVIEAVNEELEKIIEPSLVYEVVVVGNSTMRNLFFGIDISSLGLIPYEPLKKESFTMPAISLGLKVNPNARAYAPPLIGGHTGADALADILVINMHKSDRVCMIIDIGTNGEVALGNREKIFTASCAAGGAYEGTTIKCGVGAIEGAIANVIINDGRIEFSTIGNKPPRGICGSGLIDLLAEMLNKGVMSRKAKINAPFRITDGIEVYQEDIYQLITAKAGLRTDQDLLMKYYGVNLEDLETIYLAGAFGNYINAENAVEIGLLPPAPEKVVKIGNGALEGAREMLISKEKRKEAEFLAGMITHVKPNELERDFEFIVAQNMYFK
ncbi:MAG: DUF4445 domain-containing protein [Caldiserica bacterium]|nr:DUF4445 domain-containing protein [Caldisericota bacterium]